ncbi:hypothetical protein KY284_010915 [Solanum tuberosum]|nr:hypothetical protein KY284_010915 [Solanum tuberosum]
MLLLPYERHRTQNGELQLPIAAPPIYWGVDNEDRNAYNAAKRAKSLKTSGSLKHQRKNEVDRPMKVAETETSKLLDVQVVDVGPPADWVKINVYALVPRLLRDEVRVQSDLAGCLVITGQPNQLDNL